MRISIKAGIAPARLDQRSPHTLVTRVSTTFERLLRGQPSLGPLVDRDPAQFGGCPIPSIDSALLLCQPAFGVDLATEVPGDLPTARRWPVSSSPFTIRALLDRGH